MGFDPITIAATISKLESSGQVGGIKNTTTEVLPETATTADDFTADSGTNGSIILPEFILKEGERYVVTIDGTSHSAIAKYYDGIVACGNASLMFDVYPDTGENWVVASWPEFEAFAMGLVPAAEMQNPHTVSISGVTETIKPIDPKYLPNPADLPSDWIASLKTALGI